MKKLIILSLLLTFNLFGQLLTVDSNLKIGTGVATLPGYNEVKFRRSFTNLLIDTSFIIDEDRSFQYGFSIDLDLERRMTFTPGVYLKFERSISDKISAFGIGGIAYMVMPETIFGFRIGIGGNYMLLDYLGFVLELDIEPLLFGSGLDGHMMNEIRFLFGVNILF